MNSKIVDTHARFPEELVRQLRLLADEEHLSMNAMTITLVREALELRARSIDTPTRKYTVPRRVRKLYFRCPEIVARRIEKLADKRFLSLNAMLIAMAVLATDVLEEQAGFGATKVVPHP